MRDAITLPRRKFLHLAATAASLPILPRMARGQTYPVRPVRLIVGFPAGGVSDIFARLIGQWMQERLGQPFVVENKPGGGSNIAAEAVARAASDGYTLFWTTSANAIGQSVYRNLKFDLVRDFVQVAGVAGGTLVMQVNPSVPARTVAEFVAHAKADTVNMASNGIGTTSHLAGELFKMMSGAGMVHVPYRGAALALPDLIGGRVQVMFDILSSSIAHIQTGKVRPLAVTATTRSQALPDIPTVGEFLPGYQATSWNGIAAPKDTPFEIIEKLNTEINAGLADPKVKARLADLGASALIASPNDFAKFVADETEKWAKVVKFAGIKPN